MNNPSFPTPWRVVANEHNGIRNIVLAANGALVAEPMPIDGATVADCEGAAALVASASRCCETPDTVAVDPARLRLVVDAAQHWACLMGCERSGKPAPDPSEMAKDPLWRACAEIDSLLKGTIQ